MEKSVSHRLQELIQIKKRLIQSEMFILINEFEEKKKNEFNNYLKTGESSTIRLQLDTDTCLVIKLSQNEKSGVTVEKSR